MKTSDKNELVTVKSFANEMEAEIAKGYLEGDGIKSFIFKDDCGGTRPHMQLTLGIELKVQQDNFDRASELLKDIEITKPSPEKPKSGENIVAFISLFAWFVIFAGCGFLLLSLSLGKNQIFIGIILIIIGILIEIYFGRIKSRINKIT